MEPKELEALQKRRIALEQARMNALANLSGIQGQLALVIEALEKKTFIEPEPKREEKKE